MSYHKPKVYRSKDGCCICKAKSSSSRFTDSDKYKDTFYTCFDLSEEREGDICNACVLLVKRFRKIPEDEVTRNWAYVVDSRAGPGVKSFVKKSKKPQIEIIKRRKHVYKSKNKKEKEKYAPNIFSSPARQTDSPARQTDSPTRQTYSPTCQTEIPARRTDSPLSNYSDDLESEYSRMQTPQPQPQIQENSICGFFDSSSWKRVEICCGAVFQGPAGEYMFDARFYRPCPAAIAGRNHPLRPVPSFNKIPVSSFTKPVSPLLTDSLLGSSEPASSMCSSSSSSEPEEPARTTTFESIIESELKAFNSEAELDDDIDFYCSESMVDLKKPRGVVDDIDEGFFDKPTKLVCERSAVSL